MTTAMQARTTQQLFDLTGRTALITGGSRGLGLQMAHALGEAGAREMLSSRKAQDLEEAVAELQSHASGLRAACKHVQDAASAAWATGRPDEALANAVPFMQGFGHTVLAWIWLDVSLAATAADPAGSNLRTQGALGATHFFYHFELPKIAAWLDVVAARDMTCVNFSEEAF